jgi:hypothetical protein
VILDGGTAVVSCNESCRPTSTSARARMVRSQLMGAHEHRTSCGKSVQIWRRGNRYLARGRYAGKQFGKTLSGDETQAASDLRRLLTALEDGTFESPSEARRRPLKLSQAPLISIRELCARFLSEKRRLLGKKTTQAYQARLVPLIEFAEQPAMRRRWPLARDVDREFALEFRTALHSRMVNPNGHPGSESKTVSPRQVFNILDAARSLFHWARRPDVNHLPSTFANPFTVEIVGHKLKKDPLRSIAIPMTIRVKLVAAMDLWQLCHLLLPMILPLRPEEFAGLLISEVDFTKNLLRIGTRLGGRDFTKGGQSFVTPFPSAIAPLLRMCVANRVDGPLLRRRAVWDGRSQAGLLVCGQTDVEAHFEQALQAVPKAEMQAPQDGKQLFRSMLRRMGGVSEEDLAREFSSLFAKADMPRDVRFYDLRGSITTELQRSGVPYLTLRYLTGHTANDIMNEYASLDPIEEMQQYFLFIEPLLSAISTRAADFGVGLPKV